MVNVADVFTTGQSGGKCGIRLSGFSLTRSAPVSSAMFDLRFSATGFDRGRVLSG
jgi:hypothetical protein